MHSEIVSDFHFLFLVIVYLVSSNLRSDLINLPLGLQNKKWLLLFKKCSAFVLRDWELAENFPNFSTSL